MSLWCHYDAIMEVSHVNDNKEHPTVWAPSLSQLCSPLRRAMITTHITVLGDNTEHLSLNEATVVLDNVRMTQLRNTARIAAHQLVPIRFPSHGEGRYYYGCNQPQNTVLFSKTYQPIADSMTLITWSWTALSISYQATHRGKLIELQAVFVLEVLQKWNN